MLARRGDGREPQRRRRRPASDGRFWAIPLPWTALAFLLVAGCALETQTQIDPIPFPAEHVQQLNDLGLTAVQPGMPPPRISPEQAHAIALNAFNEVLVGNAIPLQSGDPLGLGRRVYVERPGRRGAVVPKPPRTAWIVLYESRVGFNCLTGSGGPGPCELTHVVVIDDQTGVLLTESSITFGP